jgi:hypothetical protein
MGLRIGDLEVQQIYLGTTVVTEIFLDNADILPAVGYNILLENGSNLLTEAAYNFLLERRPLLLTEATDQITTETGDYLTVEAS